MEKRKKILIVDDEQLSLDVLVELLKPDYEIVVTMNGEQDFDAALTADPPDLILLDITTSTMDGPEACRRLKAAETTRAIPISSSPTRGKSDRRPDALKWVLRTISQNRSTLLSSKPA